MGSVTDSYGYDGDGLFASYTAAFSGTVLYSESVVRDAVGRITQKTETVQGTTHVWGYTFDAAGRLTDVTEDGNFFSHYGYDADDNRTTYTNTSGTVNPTYDAQDRLTAYGSATLRVHARRGAHEQDGRRADDQLHLRPAREPAARGAADGVGDRLRGRWREPAGGQEGRRDAERGVPVPGRAQRRGAARREREPRRRGSCSGRKPNVPDYFTTSAGTFRILSDHLGSPRLVVNTSSGAVVEEIDYDEFGNVTNDTSAGDDCRSGSREGCTTRTRGSCGSGRGTTTRAWGGGQVKIRFDSMGDPSICTGTA